MENSTGDKSRTQHKKEAEQLQKLGLELTRLTREQLEHIDLPEELRAAVIEAQAISSNIAGRRQRQYIGALMRDVDPERIRRVLHQADTCTPVESKTEKEIRMWLNRLLTGGPDDIEAFLAVCPGQDRQRLRQLVRNSKKQGRSSKSLKLLEQLISKEI